MPASGHPIANAACAARATAGAVWFEGARLDGLALSAGHVLSTSRPDQVRTGIAQLRRQVELEELRLLHVLFAPDIPRPLLLSLVTLANAGDRAVPVRYTELWEVAPPATGERSDEASVEGATFCSTSQGERALADASLAVRARPPEPPAEQGLALEVELLVPPRESRQLAFVFAAPPPDEPAAPLVRAIRGDVAREFERTLTAWLARLDTAQPLPAYREQIA